MSNRNTKTYGLVSRKFLCCWFFLVIVLVLYCIFSWDSTSLSAPIDHSLFPNQKAFSIFENQSIPLRDELRDDLPLNQETYSLDQPKEKKKELFRCASNNDIIIIKADDGNDTVTFMFESSNQDKIADFEMKIMDIDSEHLGIPDAEYHAIVRMPSTEFARISAALVILMVVVISVTKEGLKFLTAGDIGTANIVCKQNKTIDKPEKATIIEMQEPVSLTFALRYMNSFTKATTLSETMTISLSSELLVAVEYKIADMGYIRFLRNSLSPSSK